MLDVLLAVGVALVAALDRASAATPKRLTPPVTHLQDLRTGAGRLQCGCGHICCGFANSLLLSRGQAGRRGLESTQGRLFGRDSHTYACSARAFTKDAAICQSESG